jgi:hypothetical protein
MALFQNQQLTEVGHDALSVALGGGTLTFYKLQAGRGRMVDDNDDSELMGRTQLYDAVEDFPIVNYWIDGKGQITLVGLLSSDTIDADQDGTGAGFNLTELGVFAVITDPPPPPVGGTPSMHQSNARRPHNILVSPGTRGPNDIAPPVPGTVVLYSLCNAGNQGDYIPGMGDAGSSDVVNTFEVTVVIDRAANVNIILSPMETYECRNIGEGTVGAGVYSRTNPQSPTLFEFKRLVMGPSIEIEEDADTVTIGVKTLVVDLDLFVDIGAPDIFPNFSTIQRAHDYLLDYRIPSNVIARINVGPGRWLGSTTSNISHPDSEQITIQGTVAPNKTVTSTTQAGPFVTFNGAPGTFSDMNVADGCLFMDATGGVPGQSICGAWRVNTVAADGSNIQVFTGYPAVDVNGAGITGNIVFLRSYIGFAPNQSGIRSGGARINRLFLMGDNTSTIPIFAITTYGGRGITRILEVGVSNWTGPNSTGFHCPAGARMIVDRSGACIGELGVFASGSTFTGQGVYCHANNTTGFSFSGSCSATLTACGAFGNGINNVTGGDGIACTSLAWLFFGSIWCGRNTKYGLWVNSHALATSFGAGWFNDNTSRDVFIEMLSMLTRATGAAMIIGTNNWVSQTGGAPVPWRISADGCYFSN